MSTPVTFAEDHAGVPLALEDAAKRRGDLVRRERAGRHLVEQRLEGGSCEDALSTTLIERTPDQGPTALASPRWQRAVGPP